MNKSNEDRLAEKRSDLNDYLQKFHSYLIRIKEKAGEIIRKGK